jgi:hypothetical protein
MKRSLVLIFAALLVSAVGVALAADVDVSGKVVSSSPTQLVIETDSGERMTFMVDTVSDVPMTMTAGDRVNVTYSTNDTGKYRAAIVRSNTATMPPSDSDRNSNVDRNYPNPNATPSDDVNRTGSRTAMNEPAHDRTLPRTASPLPLIALAGLLSLGAGLSLRVAARVAR